MLCPTELQGPDANATRCAPSVRGVTSRRTDGVLPGVMAGAVGLGVAELVAGIVPTGRSPVVAVADRIIRLGPPSWERKGIAILGRNDKPVLVVTVLVACIGLAAVPQ